ncbi:response regulator [Cohnella boryungensis]|uniref:Response regulator n=1 Tax=Cohnella boryungensis TaxID=768479 RepID=A0ABV8SAV1_9BACL
MKVILVDDEPVMHLIMRKMLDKLPEVTVAAAFTDTRSAAAYLSENADIGIAFVDISMPEEGGLSFAAKMENTGNGAQIVFVTSHKKYALEAYDLSVVDYLIKPVSQERLERTVNRVRAGRDSLRGRPSREVASGEVSELVITTLGDFAIQNKSGRVKWISNKSAELFAYLLLYRGKRVARSRLVTDIFGGMTRENAEKYLNTAVYQLRKSLEPFGMRETIRSENDGYVLELGRATIDYEEFERQASQFSHVEAGNAEHLLQVERLYTGDLFGSKAYVWAVHETERLAELYASFVQRLAEALTSIGSLTAAFKLLVKLHARNPLDEEIVSRLMKIHAQEGNKKGLTAQYTDYVKLLNRELGIRPSRSLILLYDSLIMKLSDSRK